MRIDVAAESGFHDRGMLLSEEAGIRISTGIAYEPFSLVLTGAGYGSGSLKSRFNCDLSASHELAGLLLGFGARGDYFNFDRPALLEDRQEVYVCLSSDPAKASILRWRWLAAGDAGGGDALYSSITCASGFSVSKRSDIEAGGTLGWGNESFSKEQLQRSGIEPEHAADWAYGEVSLGMPLMFGSFDLTPSVTYGAIIGSRLRDEADILGAETDFWIFAMTISIYPD